MNRIVSRIMLAGELPEDIRGEISPDHRVEVRVTDLGVSERRGRILSYVGAARRETSVEQAVQRIRELRDEWD